MQAGSGQLADGSERKGSVRSAERQGQSSRTLCAKRLAQGECGWGAGGKND